MERHLIHAQASLLEALGKLNSLSGMAPMILLATDADGRLLGTLTDGDVRRGLLKGFSLNDPVAQAMNPDFKFILSDADSVAQVRQLRLQGLKLIPVVSRDGVLESIIDLSKVLNRLPLSAIVMAGGKGERLRPLTLTTPKPLLKVGNEPIIDRNIALLSRYGIDDITVTTNYLAELIEQHFLEPVHGVKVKCVRETSPLGTLGAASLISHPAGGTTVVMNSDLFTTISFEEMLMRHRETKAQITIAAIPYNVSVPYALLSLEGEEVGSLEEKPSFSYYANAGIYLIDNELLNNLEPGRHMDAPDFITDAISEGARVSYYPISGSWIDIGTPQDYRHACQVAENEPR